MPKTSALEALEKNSKSTAVLLLALFIFLMFTRAPNLYAGKIIGQPALGYYLCLPKAMSLDKALPILVCLPGWSVKAKNDINLWAFPSDKRGFLLLELDVNYSNVNAGQLYRKIQNIINSISENYNIDKEKIFLAGTSAGGMMSISLSLLYPNKFKAVGVISGSRISFGAEGYLKNAKGQLFYFFHGKKDKSIPLREFYNTKKQLEKNGAIVEFKVLEQGEHTLPSSCYGEIVDWFYQLTELSR